MNKEKKFISLNLKMAIVTLVGIFLAVCVYAACTWLTEYLVSVRYTSEEAVARNVGEAFDSLEAFIEAEDVSAQDADKLKNWVSEYGDVYLYIWDNYNNYVFEAGWYTTDTEETPDDGVTDQQEAGLEIYGDDDTGRIDEDFPTDVKNRIVEFADRKYYTFIDLYQEAGLRGTMEIASLVLAFLTLLTVLLLYHGYMTRRIMALSMEVGMVREGNLEYKIEDTRNDELGTLANNVDAMRDSLIRQNEREREAWDANNQLITSMSHDIRTPLTSMIGYLDIIEGKKYDSQETLEKYIASCREKAFQLKDLSDKLFQYFLVFGNKEIDKMMESFDASILFQQLLSEHCAEIISYGYKVEFYFNIPEVSVRADISGLRRLFDNIFSNIMKYADKKENVCIYAETENNQVKILAINGMPEEAKKVESTRIGLKTCEKICSDFGGTFSYDEQERIFTVRILLPIEEISESEQPEEGEIVNAAGAEASGDGVAEPKESSSAGVQNETE